MAVSPLPEPVVGSLGCYAAGRMPPDGDSTEKTDEDSRSNRRPIELIDSPRRHRSQISARCAAE